MTTSDRKSKNYTTQPPHGNATAADDGPEILIGQEGSPILIGGGSVNIGFRVGNLHYQPVAGSPGTFVKTADEIDTILIIDGTGVLLNNLVSVVKGKNCEVTIHTRIGAGAPSDIVISSQPGGNLQLSFSDGEFGPHPTDPRRPRFNQNRKLVDTVDVLDRTSGQTLSFPVPPDGIGFIWMNNSKL
ncbi:MAG TPA: hypothetical protein VNG71_02595 [Pyrinomonadaceae bacterium]|nr:hypothetical protein [Pyrinomonadaceae bacterium]